MIRRPDLPTDNGVIGGSSSEYGLDLGNLAATQPGCPFTSAHLHQGGTTNGAFGQDWHLEANWNIPGTIDASDWTSNWVHSVTCDGSPGVYLYQHADFVGNCSRIAGNDHHLGNAYVGNDNASSIRFEGGWIAILYQHADFTGVSENFSSADTNLTDNAVGNDNASSIRGFPP